MTTSSIPLSVVVLTKDEESNITKLRSVERFNEVFVVDSAGTDRTEKIASGLGARVGQSNLDGLYPEYVFVGKVLTHGQRVYKLILFDRTKERFLNYARRFEWTSAVSTWLKMYSEATAAA
jgi:glycosyltransferase involved in cell wall biosynthesis